MRRIFWLAVLLFISVKGISQRMTDGKIFLDDTGFHYLKVSFTSQFWLRHGLYNPGTSLFGFQKSGGTDIGIRRFRLQLFGQITDRIFFYSQFGVNNFNSISDRKPSFFVHDVHGEITLIKDKLSLGMGLSGWSGLARFSSPSVASILGIDAPLYQQTTNDVTDQFLRKLGVYMKGKWGRLGYRFLIGQPMSIQRSIYYSPEILTNATISAKPPHWQSNGYIHWQFLESESNLTPYTTGTYLGKKSVLNIGVGFQHQKDASWSLSNQNKDTLFFPMFHYGADIYLDTPLGSKGNCFHIYTQWSHLNYGPGYIRNLGVMNPANGDIDKNVVNGGGVSFPAYGTGKVFYVQAGYKLRDNCIGSASCMPFVSWQRADYDRLSGVMHYYTAGASIFIHGHQSKITLAYENRPVFFADNAPIDRMGAGILQYQIYY